MALLLTLTAQVDQVDNSFNPNGNSVQATVTQTIAAANPVLADIQAAGAAAQAKLAAVLLPQVLAISTPNPAG